MLIRISFIITFLIVVSSFSFSQTPVSGTISGDTWTLVNSPYLVVGDIFVASLTIEPGVEVQFDDDWEFDVGGTLTAVGTGQDSIIFKRSASNSTGWQGIFLNNTPSTTDIAFCRIEGSINSGIRYESSAATVRNCSIINNSTSSYGGGIYFSSSSVSTVLSNCIVSYNTSNTPGSGIYVLSGSVTLRNCVISYNYGPNNYDGIYSQSSQLDIINCTIAYHSGTGIGQYSGTMTIRNSIVFFNGFQINAAVTPEYCNIEGGYAGTGNINVNPVFASSSDLRIVTGSQCIDAGDPDPIYNDQCFPPSLGTERNDMGAHGGTGGSDWLSTFTNSRLSVFPPSVEFGNVEIGNIHSKSVSVRNESTGLVNVNSLSISGSGSGNFSFNSTPFSLGPNENRSLDIEFFPGSIGSFIAMLDIISDSGSAHINLSGIGGNVNQVSGTIIDQTWTLANSPYLVIGDIFVASLIIEPGVEVQFDGDYEFEVGGELKAIGTEQDSIIFKRSSTNVTGWQGIFLNNAPSTTDIAFCRIEGSINSGIRYESSAAAVRNCSIVNNSSSSSGAGIYFGASSVPTVLSNCIVAFNSTNSPGAGIYVLSGSVTLRNCVISNNYGSNNYDGIYSQYAQLDIINCTIAYHAQVGIGQYSGTMTIRNSIIFFNGIQINAAVTPEYCNIEGGYSGTGNINVNPVFASPTNLRIVLGSQCIDAGDPNPIYNDQCFPPSLGSERNDMGAHGGPNGCGWLHGLEVNPLTVDFGRVTIDSTSIKQITVKNIGVSLLDVFSIGLSGVDSNNFYVDTTSFMLAVGDSQILDIEFTPDTEDTFSASLNFVSNGGAEFVDLYGIGVVTDISTTPTSLGFGNVFVGDSLAKSLSILNTGTDTLRISDISTDDPVFTFKQLGATRLSAALRQDVDVQNILNIAPGDTSTLMVTFKPDSGKNYNGNVIITSNDPDENTLNIPLTGTGLRPDISVNPISLDFGNVNVASDSIMTVSISNYGNTTLIVNSTTIRGADSTDFSIISGQAPFTIPSGGNPHDIQVKFAPTSQGTKNAFIRIISNDPYNNPVDISLSGIGVAPDIVVIPDTLNFDSVFVSVDTTLEISVTNVGSGDLIVDSTEFIGSDSAQFSIISGQAPFMIPSGGNPHLIEIQLSATSLGPINATLRIMSNDPNENPLDVPLKAVGVGSNISVNPDSLDFGSVLLQQDSVRSITVSNNGNYILIVDSASIFGTDSTEFSIISGQAPFTVPPGGNTHNIEIQFSPVIAGAKQAALRFFSNDPDENPLDITLKGTGIEPGVPDIAISPDSLSFGDVVVFDDSTLSLLVHNFGSENLLVDSTNILGVDSSQYSIINGQAPFIIPPGGDPDTIQIIFSPTSVGFKSAILQIVSNDPDENPLEVPLRGDGIIPDIAVSPTFLNFDSVFVFSDSILSVSVTNQGIGNLVVSSTEIVESDSLQFSFISGQGSFIVEPDSSHIIEIEFAPTSIGHKSSVLRISSNDPDENPLDVSLAGVGIETEEPDIAVNPDSLGFGNVLVSDDSIKSVLVSNFGNEDLQVTSTEILGTDSLQFSIISGQAPFTVPAGGNPDTIQIKFSPTSVGLKITQLQITSNDPDENLLNIPLTGIGILIPDIAVSPDNLDYGYVIITQDSIMAVSVLNEGNGDLTVNSTDIVGSDSSQFSFISGNGSFTIPSGGMPRTIEIQFSPTSVGGKSALLRINNNDPDENPYYIPLSGAGVPANYPQISATPALLNFSSIILNMSSELTDTIDNIGTADLIVSQTEIIGPDSDQFSFLYGNGSFTVQAGLSNPHEIGIGFLPTSIGEKSATLSIISNDPVNNPLNIDLSGVGIIDQTPADIVVDTASISLNMNTTYNFEATITDVESEIQSSSLFLRSGGKINYSELTLNKGQNDIWTTNIPANQITERGIEYYVEATHGGRITIFPEDGINNPIVSPVNVPVLNFPQMTLREAYQMISLPTNTNNQNLQNILQDDLGNYDNTQYRIFDWDQSQGKYVELSGLNITLPPGKALWLITKERKSLDVGESQSVRSGKNYSITLTQGWNMIGDPFAFLVSWGDVDASGIQGETLYFYDGSGWKSASTLEPFKGYAVFALSNTNLNIPPTEAGTTMKPQQSIQSSENEWQIQIHGLKGNFKDEYNFAGVYKQAENEWDKFDLPEPPPIGKFVSIFFDHKNWDMHSGAYAGDYRKQDEEGYIFDFTVSSNFPGQTTLILEPHNLISKYDWAVVSPVTGVNYNKENINTLLSQQDFKLLVGNTEFINNALIGYEEIPKRYSLSQNYPNPFNPITTIPFQLPTSGKVKMQVYNILGQLATTLIDEPKMAGYYKQVWNIHLSNKSIASGLYILSLKIDGDDGSRFVKNIKLLVVK